MLWFNIAGMRREECLMQAVASGSTAVGAATDYPIFKFPTPGRLREVELVFGAAVTANITNHADWTLGIQVYNTVTGSHGAWTQIGFLADGVNYITGQISGSVHNIKASEDITLYDADLDAAVTVLGECGGRTFLAEDILEIRRTCGGDGHATGPILVLVDWDSAATSAGAAPTCEHG